MNKRTLHFSLGPVQGFVAQARRTRDFWAGSFLLSYLSGQAMNHIIQHDGEIVFPAVKDEKGRLDPLLQAIQAQCNGSSVQVAPIIGTLPNRFQARVPNGFEPESCCKAVQDTWQYIADKVYEQYVLPIEDFGYGTRSIWKRQIQSFWDIVWVLGEESDILDLRKNWRSYVPPEEPGDKCTIMGNMQEISGYIRVKQRNEQNKFWKEARNIVLPLDLRDDERLCAVLMIKRLFPPLAQEIIGWPVIESFPSTLYMSAVPWMTETLENNKDFARDFAARAFKMPGVLSEYTTNIDCLDKLADKDPYLRKFISLDGNCFFKNTLDNDALWSKPEDTEGIRQDLKNMLKNQEVSPFYAFLLMDGDRMGALLKNYPNDQKKISLALNTFSHQVVNVIKAHNGITIYAGGDDVLAFLPLDDALGAAAELRKKYKDVFGEKAPAVQNNQATISAAIVYAHNHAPLNLIFPYAQELLSQKAKDETGRDAVAISAWKTGGPVLTWSVPWQVILYEDGTSLIDKLVREFSGGSGVEEKYSSSFFYNVRKRFRIMEQDGWLPDDIDLERLLGAEYMRRRDKVSEDVALVHMRNLLKVLHQYRRQEDGTIVTTKTFNFDGALLVRFLATKGVFI